MNIINIYIDGSCINNKRTKQFDITQAAGIGIYFDKKINGINEISMPLFYHPTTNIRAEYMACIKAIEYLNEHKHNYKQAVIYTDNTNIINSLSKWLVKWKQYKYKMFSRKQPENLDLICYLDYLIKTSSIKITLKHIKAHTHKQNTHSRGNNMADILAKKGSTKMIKYFK